MKYFISLLLITHLHFALLTQDIVNFLDSEDLTPRIDALAKEYVDLDIFSGVVLVAQEGIPVYHKAFGMADRNKKIPNTVLTKFDIGSMNKTFTLVVILQLVEEGKLQLSDNLGKFLDDFPDEAADNITVRHLLEHSSGYGDYHRSPGYFESGQEEKTISALVEKIRNLPLLFEPGTENEYSNSGYILLGAIIEKTTGKSYHQNVRERIVDVLGLAETYVDNKYGVPNRAIGYLKNIKSEIMDNLDFQDVANPDGGFQSTASDILKFYREFHYGNLLLKKETKMNNERFRMMAEYANTQAAIPHAGGFEGANTVIFEVLRDKISIIVFANMDEPVAEQLGAGILAIIRGQEPNPPSLPAIQNVYQAYINHGLDFVKDHFEELTVNFHPEDPRGLIINQIGYFFLREEKVDKAIELFTLNTELFPEDPNLWDSLGEGYLKKGDRTSALRFYRKALELDPGLESAKKMLRLLEK